MGQLEPELPAAAQKREYVRDMFDRIAPRYDLMNRLISLGRDQTWRRQALNVAGIQPGDRVIDLATGTGDLADLVAKRGATVYGVDLAPQMLVAAKAKFNRIDWVRTDAEQLPFRDGSVDFITCGFALRNFVELEDVFRECARVLRPSGRFVILELDRPQSALFRWGNRIHTEKIVPALGAWLSDRKAYRYLPSSTTYLPDANRLRELFKASGFVRVDKRTHMMGSVQRLIAVRGSF